MYFLFSSYFYCLFVIVFSVNMKLMTNKFLVCASTLGNKALSDSDNEMINDNDYDNIML